MSAQLEILEFDDGDGGEPADRPGLVLLRFCELVHERGEPFRAVVMELLEQAIAEAAEEK